MEPSPTRAQAEDHVYIDLDDPTRWWLSIVGFAAIVLIAAVLVGPWLINIDGDESDSLVTTTLQTSGSVCRPNSNGVPAFLDPTVASWNRFCEWFIAPGEGSQN